MNTLWQQHSRALNASMNLRYSFHEGKASCGTKPWCYATMQEKYYKAAQILKASFSKIQSHMTLGAGQDTNSNWAKSVQLRR